MSELVIAIIVLAVILCFCHDKNCDAMEKERAKHGTRGCREEDCESCKFKLTCVIEKLKSR